jgi:peptidoglycan/LPS O-acetylase OafA/YrhL
VNKKSDPLYTNAANRFEMLDLLRGIAALAVLIYHSQMFLGFELLPKSQSTCFSC